MARLRKCFIHNSMLEVCFRTEEGLPLVAAPIIEFILHGILARAQSLYPVTICHLVVMTNHVHLILVVENPGCVDCFVEYVKRESAHAINHLLGKKKHTVWCDGYDSPVILDSEKALERIVYLYTNPQQANLVNAIEDYPNVSSWQWFLDGGAELMCKRIPRDRIEALPQRTLSLKEHEQLAAKHREQPFPSSTLRIEPHAWMKCFADTKGQNPDLIRVEIIKRIRAKEALLDKARTRPTVGAHALRLASMRAEYRPKKRGKRMVCLSSFKMLRVRYLMWFKDRCQEATAILERWKAGDWLAVLPPGFFSPGGFLRANINPLFSPLS